MREVISLSFPKEMAKEIDRAVKVEGLTNKSEFFRELFMRWLDEDLLFQDIREAEDDVKKGKVYTLSSFKELMDSDV